MQDAAIEIMQAAAWSVCSVCVSYLSYVCQQQGKGLIQVHHAQSIHSDIVSVREML